MEAPGPARRRPDQADRWPRGRIRRRDGRPDLRPMRPANQPRCRLFAPMRLSRTGTGVGPPSAPPRPCRVARPLLVSALLPAGRRPDGADSVLGVLALGVGAWARRWGWSNSGTGSSPWRVGGLRLGLGLGSGAGSGERAGGSQVGSGRIRSGDRVRRGVWSGSESGPGRVGSGQRVAPGARRWGIRRRSGQG
jgi:hypothetical protein